MNDKELVAKHAAQRVQNGMVVGLGTGSTANYFIDELARRVKDENLLLKVVSSSVVSSVKAESLGLALVAIEHIRQLDLYVDGADEVTAENTLLKGQGADLVKEKLLANASTEFIVLVDQSKMVKKIGEKFPIPIEVMPIAWQIVKYQLEDLGGQGQLRQNANGGMAVSSHGSLILDMTFPATLNSQQLDNVLNDMPGVVEHGIFCSLAKTVLLAEEGDVKEIINTP